MAHTTENASKNPNLPLQITPNPVDPEIRKGLIIIQ